MRRSIRVKIITRTLFAMLILSLALAVVCTAAITRLSRTYSEELMTQRCEEESLRFDNRLSLVRHSVNMITEYAVELYADEHMDALSEEYEKRVRDLAITVANDTDGAMAVYMRYNPVLTGDGKSGFFWSKKDSDSRFKEEVPTDILAYNATDVEHVGWFYVPKTSGKPLWMTPYYNKNLNVFMISYIVPLYTNGEFTGVIGMDIDFNSIMDVAGSTKFYDSGSLALLDLTEHIVYYRGDDGNAVSEQLSQKLYNHVTTINKDSDLLELSQDGQDLLTCTRKLSNGMILYLSVPMSEVNAIRNTMMVVMFVITMLLGAISGLYLYLRMKEIIEPINKLVEVADNYTNGNWDHKYICETGDELQELSESIYIMADQTKDYITQLDNLVRVDTLTGIRNRTSYAEIVEEIKNNRHGEYEKYAVAVMDLDHLKEANDNLGHEVGDILIKEASRYICEHFRHSACFRIGGDEFVAILINEDYTDREKLKETFRGGLGYDTSGMTLSISFGMADCEEADTYEAVFRLADDRMYENKAAHRAGRKG